MIRTVNNIVGIAAFFAGLFAIHPGLALAASGCLLCWSAWVTR